MVEGLQQIKYLPKVSIEECSRAGVVCNPKIIHKFELWESQKKYNAFSCSCAVDEKTEKALKNGSAAIIAETKALNSYLVISDAQGNIKKIPAKDL